MIMNSSDVQIAIPSQGGFVCCISFGHHENRKLGSFLLDNTLWRIILQIATRKWGEERYPGLHMIQEFSKFYPLGTATIRITHCAPILVPKVLCL